MFGNLLKAVVAVAVTPIAVVVDTVMLPSDASSSRPKAYSRTGELLKSVGENIVEAVKK